MQLDLGNCSLTKLAKHKAREGATAKIVWMLPFNPLPPYLSKSIHIAVAQTSFTTQFADSSPYSTHADLDCESNARVERDFPGHDSSKNHGSIASRSTPSSIGATGCRAGVFHSV